MVDELPKKEDMQTISNRVDVEKEQLIAENNELKEALRQQSEFTKASDTKHRDIWIQAQHAVYIFQSLSKAIVKANAEPLADPTKQEKRKIFLRYTDEGEVLWCVLEQ